MMVAGLGFRAGVDADALLAAIDAALAAHGLTQAALGCLAVLPKKAGEKAAAEAAVRLGIPLAIAEDAALAEAATRLATSSARSIAATGFGSAAEAAALAVAGASGRLLAPRLVVGAVTCAIAQRGEET